MTKLTHTKNLKWRIADSNSRNNNKMSLFLYYKLCLGLQKTTMWRWRTRDYGMGVYGHGAGEMSKRMYINNVVCGVLITLNSLVICVQDFESVRYDF